MANKTNRVALVLEDEALIALDVADGLSAKGFFVAIASSCAVAKQWLADNPFPDVAVIDVSLSDGPAHPVAASLVSLGVPLVVHSGQYGPSLPEDEVFVDAVWINKPSFADDLLGAIERAISKGRRENEHAVARP